MSFEELKPYILPALVLVWFGVRRWRFARTRKKLPGLLASGAVVVDVRSPAEFSSGSSPDAINIPLGELESRLSSLDKSKPIVLCCASGARSGVAVGILKRNGFKLVTNAGPWQHTVV